MLRFDNPTTWVNGFAAQLLDENSPYGDAAGGNRRYGPGWYTNNPLGHWGVLPEVDLASLNARLLGGTLPSRAIDVLAAAHHDGAALTQLDWADLFVLRLGAATYMRAIFDAISDAYPRPTPGDQPLPMQTEDVRRILLAAGDPRALDPNQVRAVAEQYGALPREQGISKLSGTLPELVFPASGQITSRAAALYDQVQSYLRQSIGASNEDQRFHLANIESNLNMLLRELVDAAREGSQIKTGNLQLAAAYVRRAIATCDATAADPGTLLDSLAKQDEAISDALNDPTPAFVGLLSSQPVIS